MIMVKMAGSLVKEAIVNTTLGMILGCDIVLHRIGVADTIIFGVGFALLILTREAVRSLGVG